MLEALCKRLGLSISEENFEIRAEQIRTLVKSYPTMIMANAVMAPLVAWLMWDKVDHAVLLAWVALLYAFHARETWYWMNYPKAIDSIVECRRWQRQFLLSDALTGAMWGSAGVFMFVPGDPLFQAFLLCIMMGLAAGAVAGNLVFPLSQQIYVAFVILPIMVTLLLQGSSEYYLLSAMVAVFLVFLAKIGREQGKHFELSIRRGFENSQLVTQLQRANEQLALAQRGSNAGVFDWDIGSGELSWSNELFTLFGLDQKTVKISMDIWSGLVHPDDRQMIWDITNEAVRAGSQLFGEYRIVLPGGQVRSIMAIGNVARNERGESTRMTGLCIDVTTQKDIQRRAQQAESRYQALIEQAGSALFVHDLEGRLLEVNRQTCETLGYSRDELLQMTLRDISASFDVVAARACWSRLDSGTPETFTATHRRKDGSMFPVEVRLSSIVLGEQKMIMALASDISERIRFEAALQRSEERYRTFAEKLPLGITVLQDGLIKYVNHATTDLIGYSVDELLGKPFPHLIHEDDRAGMLDLHRRRMQGEDVEGVFAARIIRKDGVVRQWELHTSTTEWDGKRSSLAILADITERVAMEERLRSSLRQLEEKELSKTRFLAAAGHDLRQPVAAANLFVDALKHSSPNQRQSELISRLDQSMTIFSGLLERLLDISKFDAGLIKPQIVSFELAELLGWLEQNFAGSALERKLGFRIAFPMRERLVVRTDIGLLQSVMMNLVSNAIKYTPEGGVLVAARPRRDHVLLQVWDTGHGIAEKDIGKIFDEFYQVGNPQRNRDAGLGLGLSICRRAAALLGGEIACRSKPGRGSVFELAIPLDLNHQVVEHFSSHRKSDAVSDESLFEGKRIAVLEDDQLVAEGMVRLLQGLGADILYFQNAEEALKHKDITTADYFVVDYSLSKELTGTAFLQALQGKTEKPIKGVIVTGETSLNFIEGIADLPWPVLHKPVNYSTLAAALNS